ncbi:TetR/AcrR family transcriptional regulator [Schlegelella sp. S2-27]|uniref:TetR/AcrR family transcriptional regulator n=1 Tax=Caldimonas mangrovi TaxID=2944811 RepID=A0ABT0YY77_9BURK|nr:TetR/AcrR family transcriptional regulator [Caldimonas mangrovi]MCM5682788.1 TetR/AcrR family transcriptional regulator [Caldimonas mangrovi]
MLPMICIGVCPRTHTYVYGSMLDNPRLSDEAAPMADTERLAPLRRRKQPSAATAEQPRISLTPERWIECATALLVDHGIDAVRVDVVAKTLGVTRGSFYWHFKDRDDLLLHMLETWRNAATEQIIQRFEKVQSDPRALVKELLSLPFRGRAAERAARIELAIRAWARSDPMARQALDDVDSRRLSYIAQCFSALGFGIAEARSRAFILYGYEVAESLLHSQGTASQKADRSALIERLLLASP